MVGAKIAITLKMPETGILSVMACSQQLAWFEPYNPFEALPIP